MPGCWWDGSAKDVAFAFRKAPRQKFLRQQLYLQGQTWGSGSWSLVLGPWSFVLLAPTSIIVKCSEAFCQLQTSIAISLLPDEIKAQFPPFYLAFSSLFLFLHDFSSFLLFSLIFSTFSLQHPFGQHAFSPRFFAFFAIATFPMCESVCELCIYPWQGLLQRVESQRKQKVLFAQFSFS